MGWNSANPIFEVVADKLIELGASDAVKTSVLEVLIRELQYGDWDTEEESLGIYSDDEAIVEAFRRNDIILHCGNESEADDWCELEKDHGGLHQNYDGTVQW